MFLLQSVVPECIAENSVDQVTKGFNRFNTQLLLEMKTEFSF